MRKWKAVPCTDYTYDIRDENGHMIASNLNQEDAYFIVKLANEQFDMVLVVGKEGPCD